MILISEHLYSAVICMRTSLFVILFSFFYAPIAFSIPLQKEAIYQKLRDASLEVLVDGQLRGSGWFVAPHGLALTAAHLLKGSGQIEVLTPVEGRLRAKLVAVDLGHDLALLSVVRPGNLFPILELETAAAQVGQQLYSYGTVLNRHGLFFEGVLSRNQLQYEWNDLNHVYTEVYAVNAMTPAGLSGAPWVNANGKVIGVQSGMMLWQDNLSGISFVAPVPGLNNFLENKGGIKTFSLGATFAEPWEGGLAVGGVARNEGLRILKLVEGGALEAAGVAEGEILYALERKALHYRDDLLRQIAMLDSKRAIVLTVGKERGPRREITIRLDPIE